MDNFLRSLVDIDVVGNDQEMGMSEAFQEFLAQVEIAKSTLDGIIEARNQRLDAYFEKAVGQKKFIGKSVSVTMVDRVSRKAMEGVAIPEELTTVEVKLNTKAINKYVKENGSLPYGIEEESSVSYRVKLNETA